MIDRTYRCDLCRSMHEPGSSHIFGIYWGGYPETILHKSTREVEHHLCWKCISGILNTFGRATPPDSASPEGK